jgi:hypothetical protein
MYEAAGSSPLSRILTVGNIRLLGTQENNSDNTQLAANALLILFVSLVVQPFKAEARLNNSVRTAKKTPHFTITKISWLTLFKKTTLVRCNPYRNTHMHSLQILNY